MFSENILLREAEDGWVDVVNVVIMILWFAVFLKHGGSEFSQVLMSTRFKLSLKTRRQGLGWRNC